MTALQAYDLLEMLKKEEEMLSAVKERRLKVLLLNSTVDCRYKLA